jgi:hypothetical protein
MTSAAEKEGSGRVAGHIGAISPWASAHTLVICASNEPRRPTIERIAFLSPFGQRLAIATRNRNRQVVLVTASPDAIFTGLESGRLTTIAACPSYADPFWMELRRRVGRHGKVVHVEVLVSMENAWRAIGLFNRGLATRVAWLQGDA